MYGLFGNSKYAQIVTISLALALLLSCSVKSDNERAEAGSLDSFTTIDVDTTMALFSSYPKPDCHLTLNYEIPQKASSNKILEAAKSMIVALTQNGEYADKEDDVEEMIKQYTKSYIMNYLEEGMEAIANNSNNNGYEEEETWMTYEEICKGKVLYNADGYFSYSVQTYSYTGGAHGMTTNRVGTLDLISQKVITLDMLGNEEELEIVRETVLKKLNETYQLLTDDINLPENFYLSDKGVTFVYDPLDIAAYSEGEIDVTIDLKTIR